MPMTSSPRPAVPWVPGLVPGARGNRAWDLTGMKFSHLTAISRSEDTGSGKKPVSKWICVCDCGKVTVVPTHCLLSGHTKSCGCLHQKHGYCHKERLYGIWINMRRRCSNPSNIRWKHYGGKGVQICTEWDDYRVFRQWALSHGYREDLTIDRKDVNGNYTPENCQWVDRKTQANNTTRNHWLELNGTRYTMSQLADHLGLTYSALQHRVDRGWSMERIVSQPQRR